MVFLFWTIAGYTASLKPFKQMQFEDKTTFQKSLSSSLVRRGFRLYLPPFASVLMIGALTGAGMLEPAWHIKHDKIYGLKNFYQLPDKIVQRQGGICWELWRALKASMSMLDIFESGKSTAPEFYDSHLWCISIQYKMAILVCLVLLAASRLTSRYRPVFLAGVLLFGVFYCRSAAVTSHFAGVFLAEIDVRYSTRQQRLPSKCEPSEVLDRPISRWRWALKGPLTTRLVHLTVFLFGCTVCSAATWEPEGQLIIGPIIKKYAYFFNTILGGSDNYIAIGAVLMTYSGIHCDLLHRFLGLFSYLGKVSYSFYLVHGVIHKLVVWPMLPRLYAFIGTAGPGSNHATTSGQVFVVWVTAIIISLPLTIWVSDMFYRGIELQASRLEFWVDRKIST
ncbi:hypothetical protein K461DRAFT_278400 [Myriangium duriaei CBS 260.36]|uniref:Acyltransferase 3 domain-containing protein n=1 Tax=Myriangium duriaei CBS 260.36 TaxID=1168546 RepID=A0A9P4J759_9PEZI|nr:hypothetical protein K461DRAFT_278400 [Myriangium duriaei CBS 260.36]